MAAEDQDMEVENQDTDSEYMRVPIEQHTDFVAEYKYGLDFEGNKQDLEARCILVDIEF